MIANLISANPALNRPKRRLILVRWSALILAVANSHFAPFAEAAEPIGAHLGSFSARARKEFESARRDWISEARTLEATVKFGQAAFDWAEFSENDKQREEIALQGIDACRQAVALEPKSAAAHYYLAMNLGQLARTKSLGALRLVTEMEREFQRARELDETFDYGGPDRNLGLLYFEAPGWPTSIGNRAAARRHLQFSVSVSPNYPDNRLNLITAYLKWGEKAAAQRELEALEGIWLGAKKELAGERWEMSWADWDQRRRQLQSKLPAGRRLEGPDSRR